MYASGTGGQSSISMLPTSLLMSYLLHGVSTCQTLEVPLLSLDLERTRRGRLIWAPCAFTPFLLWLVALQLWIAEALRQINATPGPATVNDNTISGVCVCVCSCSLQVREGVMQEGFAHKTYSKPKNSLNPQSGTRHAQATKVRKTLNFTAMKKQMIKQHTISLRNALSVNLLFWSSKVGTVKIKYSLPIRPLFLNNENLYTWPHPWILVTGNG